MTNKELIEILQEYPENAKVVACCDDSEPINKDDIRYIDNRPGLPEWNNTILITIDRSIVYPDNWDY